MKMFCWILYTYIQCVEIRCLCLKLWVCSREDRWALVRCCGSLNTDEGQTEGWLASSLFSILPCRSLSPLCVSGSPLTFTLVVLSWALIYLNYPVTSFFIPSAFNLPLSLSVSPHPLPILVVNVDIGWTITITKDELEGENAAFLNSTVYNFAIKRCHLNIFTPDFKQPLCFTGTQGAASSPVASPGLMA